MLKRQLVSDLALSSSSSGLWVEMSPRIPSLPAPAITIRHRPTQSVTLSFEMKGEDSDERLCTMQSSSSSAAALSRQRSDPVTIPGRGLIDVVPFCPDSPSTAISRAPVQYPHRPRQPSHARDSPAMTFSRREIASTPSAPSSGLFEIQRTALPTTMLSSKPSSLTNLLAGVSTSSQPRNESFLSQLSMLASLDEDEGATPTSPMTAAGARGTNIVMA